MTRHYISHARANIIREQHIATYRPGPDFPAFSGRLGEVAVAEYYEVDDDDPRLNTTEEIDA